MSDKSSEVSAEIENVRRENAAFLDLSGLGLTELPESIGQLTSLIVLDLGGNLLTDLPASFGRLTKLVSLYLHDNRMVKLPEVIGQLTQLKDLDLGENQLTELPESLRDLTSLEKLFLHGNDALGLPAEVLGSYWGEESQTAEPARILEYYFRVRGDRRPLNEAKLILVGRGAVGKTSLVNRLIHNRFDKDEKKTEGINITEWPLQLNDKEQVRLNVWDFGGQEIMHATHQFFLTQRSLYLLVLNGREGGEDADADYWLKLIESFGGESPVIVVLNKFKEHPFDLNRRGLQQKYVSIRDPRNFIETDCEEGIGIEELRAAITRETDGLQDLRASFPASWFAIKEHLAEMKERNYLSFEEYRVLCARLGEKDKEAQESLAGFLHRLGIALNYNDDPRLQDTHVLNPHWVTNGIYKILNAEKLERQKGEIGLSDLGGILDEDEYPRGMHRFVFDLMKKFELCFSFPDDDSRYLIPELLDKQQPEEAAEFRPGECLNFEYHYTGLPEGLLPRFIVRTHALSEGLQRWRTGAILAFEGCRALVKGDVQDKRVFINVAGPASNRRRLLAVIRADFERIHRDIRNLQPQEMVPAPEFPEVLVPYEKLLAMERDGFKKTPELVKGRMVELDVRELLNGVDLEGTRRESRREMELRRETVRLFISYSHRDEKLREELQTHLKLLHRQGVIDAWDDRRIDPGDEWKKRIDDNLERADIILLLVSADFMASDYCFEKEMERAVERHAKGEARVIPVIARDVSWRTAPFSDLQALPKDGLAVELWANRDSAWRNVSEGIEAVAEELRKQSGRPFQI